MNLKTRAKKGAPTFFSGFIAAAFLSAPAAAQCQVGEIVASDPAAGECLGYDTVLDPRIPLS